MNTVVPHRNGRRFGTLLNWDPMRIFEDLVTWQPAGSEVVWSPFSSPLSVRQADDGATITVDMPGVDAADIDLTFETGTLSITGNRGEQTYKYVVTLGDTFDPNQIEAQLDKGVLTIQAHKRPEAKPRKILVAGVAEKALDSGDK
ncbi:MAG TPA: Hsp20/alpha crystallin family protein [Kofleriaceae bacterium]|nr:Hsp20/alpha crystallin family protein [Kofleriaceae bacterium]